jgi:hypothetical protein
MQTLRSLESAQAYVWQLVGAGLGGIDAARRELDGGAITPATVWQPAAIGTTVGMITAHLLGKRKDAFRTALGGVLGLGAGLLWAARGSIPQATRTVVRHVNAARDAHWLEAHPIDYA